MFNPQSRKSAMLFLKSSELGLPQPLTRRGVCPPPPVLGGGAHSLAREGLGESQFRRGDIHWHLWYSLHRRTLWFIRNFRTTLLLEDRFSVTKTSWSVSLRSRRFSAQKPYNRVFYPTSLRILEWCSCNSHEIWDQPSSCWRRAAWKNQLFISYCERIGEIHTLMSPIIKPLCSLENAGCNAKKIRFMFPRNETAWPRSQFPH